MKLTLVAGARPNFMKIAPLIHEIQRKQREGRNISYRLVHTGQHFDKNMSDVFFTQLNIPHPDNNLGAGGGTQAQQTAAIMVGFENELLENPCDIVIVVGDVTSTMACTITARKLHIEVAHIEAGIRSGDWTMPEEINRVVTDSITNYFFTTSETANQHLVKSGFDSRNIYFVGNTMIDTLYTHLDSLEKPAFWDSSALSTGNYFTLTLHRPSNVDDARKLYDVLSNITREANGLPIIFPVHPRTKKILDSFNSPISGLILTSPLSYKEFIYIVKESKGVITDSGGITEEATVLGIPCITLRNSTERPETCTIGTNELVGDDIQKLKLSIQSIIKGTWKKGGIPPLWDGMTSGRIIDVLIHLKG